MTVQEIKKRIAEIDTSIFMINMIDHWSAADKEQLRKLELERNKLQDKLFDLETIKIFGV